MNRRKLVVLVGMCLIAAFGFGITFHPQIVHGQTDTTQTVVPTLLSEQGSSNPDALLEEKAAQMTQCEMVDTLEILEDGTTRPTQIQRCIGPSLELLRANPNLDHLDPPPVIPEPNPITPAAIEKAPEITQ